MNTSKLTLALLFILVISIMADIRIGVRVGEEIKPYQPLEKQKEFHKTNARYRLYSGAFRAGKTLSGCIEGLKQSLKYNNNRGVIARQTYPELRDTTRYTFLNEIYIIYPDKAVPLVESDLVETFNKSENYLRFKNKSEVLFRSLDNPDKLKSLNLGWFYIDEGSETEADIFKMFKGRLSLSNVGFRGGWVTTNPDTEFHWLYQDFIDKKTRKKNHIAIHANTKQNKYLTDDYLEDVEEYDEDYYNRFIMGEWGVFEGLIYKSFSPKNILKHKDFDFSIIKDWYIGMDFGSENPTAIILIGVDNDDKYYVIDEFYKRHTGLSDWVKQIEDWKEQYNIKGLMKGWGDPSGFIKQMQKESIDLRKGVNDVFEGIEAVSRAITSNRFFVLDNCYYVLREIKLYKWRKIQGVITKEQPVKQNDHAMDAIRYVIYSRIAQPEAEIVLLD